MAEKKKEVRMIGRISGTRDGKDWPAPGEKITLPETEALQLIASGLAADPTVEEKALAAKAGVETATTSGNRPLVTETAADAKARADALAAEQAASDLAAAEAAAKLTADAAKSSAGKAPNATKNADKADAK
ncbi:hypothetical protein [Arthrobacter sp. B1805]|uniref:hypothetical protein n=1 Tax=Arthrobacter sp. B1805 TaxID=2058892 RepID=UPI0011B0B0EE|nr:hypothetical protein [Arthrobacter sp. B1805]